MYILVGHITCLTALRVADSKTVMSSANRRSYDSHVGQSPLASIHSGCCAMRSRCNCFCKSAYVRIRPQFARSFPKRRCPAPVFIKTASRAAHAPTTAHWKDLSVRHQWDCGFPLSGDALRLSPIARSIQKLGFMVFDANREKPVLP